MDRNEHLDREEMNEAAEADFMELIEATETPRQANESAKMSGVRKMLSDIDRLPFKDCSLAGCDGYAVDGDEHCEECLKALRASV